MITGVMIVKNALIRPFEHQHVEVTASVGPKEDPAEVLQQLKDWVNGQLYDTTHTIEIKETVTREVRE